MIRRRCRFRPDAALEPGERAGFDDDGKSDADMRTMRPVREPTPPDRPPANHPELGEAQLRAAPADTERGSSQPWNALHGARRGTRTPMPSGCGF